MNEFCQINGRHIYIRKNGLEEHLSINYNQLLEFKICSHGGKDSYMSQPKESPEMEALLEMIAMGQCRIDSLFKLLEERNIIVSQEQLENESLKIFHRDLENRRDQMISLINVHRHEKLGTSPS
jgi:hypothetical protein